MLNLKSNDSGFEIRATGGLVAIVDQTLKLGDLLIEEPGEYESDGVEIIYGEQAALIVWEQLQLVYIFNAHHPRSFEKSQFAPCDAVILRSNLEGLERGTFNEILETYDPRIVVVKKGRNEELLKTISALQEMAVLKLSATALPTEGRELVVLT